MRTRDDRGEVTYIETDGGSSFKWFVMGAAMGTALGLLFAPQSGERTRRDISKRVRRARAAAGDRLDQLVDDVQDRGRRIKSTVENWADDAAAEVREGKRRIERAADGARDDLERRLADARMRRRAAMAEAPDTDE